MHDRSAGAPRWGFFLRAETMHGVYTYLEEVGGGPRLHELSHGESFLEILLAALPGATVLEVGPWGVRRTSYDDLEIVAHWKAFLAEPMRYLRHVLCPTRPTAGRRACPGSRRTVRADPFPDLGPETPDPVEQPKGSVRGPLLQRLRRQT